MLKRTNDLKGLDVELELTPTQLSILSAGVRTQAWDVMQLLMEDQVRRFNLKLINTSPVVEREVLAAHYLAKAVAQFYAGLMDRIEEACQVEAYNSSTVGTQANPENRMDMAELR